MRFAKCVTVMGFAALTLGTCQSTALADIRPVTLTVAPGNSSATAIDISVKFAIIADVSEDEIPLQPQRSAAETTSGLASDRAPLNGTIFGYYDSTNGIFQVSRAELGLDDTGSYCPGDGEASFEDPTQGPGSDPNDDPAEECPYAESGELGYYVGTSPFVPNADGAALSVRETLITMRGSAPITGGTNIDVLNWHGYVLDSEDGIDGYGPTFGEGGTAAIGYDVSRLQEPEATIHFEAEGGETEPINEATFFDGTFTVAGSNATFNFPLYLPFWVYDPASEPTPDEYFRIFTHSVNETTGLNDQIQTTGTVGDPIEVGDANEDGKVDGLDVNILSLNWQKGAGANAPGVHTPNQRELHTAEHPKYSAWDEGDFDLNATTDETDLALLVANFGAGAGGGSGSVGQVPEPGTAVLAAVAGCLIMLGTRRRGA